MKKYKRIRDLREDMDLNQTEMAKELDLNQRTYSRYENADSLMPMEVLVKIADFHNVSIDYLLDRTDVRRRYPKKKPGNKSETQDVKAKPESKSEKQDAKAKPERKSEKEDTKTKPAHKSEKQNAKIKEKTRSEKAG